MTVGAAHAQPAPAGTPEANAAAGPTSHGQGVAIVGQAGARDDAFALARAVYSSSLRPRALDELRARILGGDPPPPGAAKSVRELAELRASVTSEDAASRRLLASIAREVNAKALLVVRRVPGAQTTTSSAADGDAGTSASEVGDGGTLSAPPTAGTRVVARLFLAETEDFDAARYEPDETGGWRSTVTSLSPRFPAPVVTSEVQPRKPPTKTPSDVKESKPFYASTWFWGAIGAAVVIGGLVYFASQDTDPGPIHLQMKVPR